MTEEISAAKERFRGCCVATLTPFDEAGRVNVEVAAAHASWLVENGIDGLCPAGTTGEFLYLNEAERAALISAVVNGANGRVTVIAGVWAWTVEEIARNANVAADAGADAVFLPPPIYYQLTDAANAAFYAAVNAVSPLPVFAYNIPQNTGNEITLTAFERMLDDGSVIGLKDSSGKPERFAELIARFGDRAVLFAAGDSFASTGRKLGADGFISAIANLLPNEFARLWAGDDSLQPVIDALRSTLKREGAIPALKRSLTSLGFPFGGTRLPFS